MGKTKIQNIGKRCGAESLNILYRTCVRSFVYFEFFFYI